MRVRSFLRPLRAAKGMSIGDVCEVTGLARGEVSMFERGHSIPRDLQAAAMVAVYGDPRGWYPPGVLRVLAPDLADCAGCGDELDPDASRSRRYHDETCRAEARRSPGGRPSPQVG